VIPVNDEIGRRFAEIHPAFDPQAALVEANRCLYCFDAPCTAACPTHIDVPRFIKKIATANLRGSAVTILDANILGSSCSRVELLARVPCGCVVRRRVRAASLQQAAHRDWPIAAARNGLFLQ
jgi:dihydropyrimidine dehydrogenase (NAD+) subunit PreT